MWLPILGKMHLQYKGFMSYKVIVNIMETDLKTQVLLNDEKAKVKNSSLVLYLPKTCAQITQLK